MKDTKNFKRGFFFTAMALAILSFMLLTSQVWVRTFEQQDASAVVRFKGEAMRLVLSTLSDEAMTHFANASAFYATYKLVNATEIEGLDQIDSIDPNNPKTGRVEKVAYELMVNGSTSPSGITITYSPEEKQAYTISAWQGKIREAANVMGFNATFGNVQNFSFRQLDPWTVGIYFQMQMNISDLDNTMHQSKMLTANSSFSINGFVDPMEVRDEFGLGHANPPQKQIWKDPKYSTPSDVAPTPPLVDTSKGIGSASEGYGWFFGPITFDYPDRGIFTESEANNEGQYILVHPYDENLSRYADAYGAVIVTSDPGLPVSRTYIDKGCNVTETNQTECLNCFSTVTINPGSASSCKGSTKIYANQVSVPMIQTGSTWLGSVQSVTRNGMPVPTQQFVLIDNEKTGPIDKQSGYHRIWDITALRDMTVCGFYVNGAGPSFFQRMVAGAESLSSPNLGIESFLVGQWAGGADDQDNDKLSRLDWEFYQAINDPSKLALVDPNAMKIKGMPGCKNTEMCSSASNATSKGVGRFKLSQDAISRYSMENIKCAKTATDDSSPC